MPTVLVKLVLIVMRSCCNSLPLPCCFSPVPLRLPRSFSLAPMVYVPVTHRFDSKTRNTPRMG